MNENPAPTVITGLGVVAPTGIGVEEHWESLLAGKSGIARISRFDPTQYPVRYAGEVKGFVAHERVPNRLIRQTDHWTHMALYATELALADAGANPEEFDEYEMAVVTSSSSGGTEFGQHEMDKLYNNGPAWVGAYQSIAWFYAATTGQLSIRHGMRGPCGVVCAEQAGGIDAIGKSRRLIRNGTRLVITGGLDASLCPYGLVAQLPPGRLSTVDDPEMAFRPFDAEASGHLPGEGGAILIAEVAAARNEDRRWGVIAGYAAGFDPAPQDNGPRVVTSVLSRALSDAGLAPSDVDVVFADAAGVPSEDLAEAQAISAVFGAYAVPVTAPKTMTGRLYGGGSSLDVATALLALRHGIVPPTTGTVRPAADYEIDLVVDEPRALPLRHAMVLARGYGGYVSALVLSAP
ncbi:ketosynthase chain-length factor [Nocardia sp. CDC153]|uniref:ketosynthase chain-length factor n=1 Tax=Nocardia sp. CDC153 TaxID=3112167 RepID=UPI002DB57D18|nr:ketosynthase chain-length factor [Nocardia sp. CDC153]MEC3952019.1 ketosynthase chain-length factor [Nocardia sp. CDC153]